MRAAMPTPSRKLHRERVIPFTAGDGFPCNLINISGSKEPWREPVLMVHGAGVRANIFRAPVETNLVDLLVDEGYDVWLENWRASIDAKPNCWTLDQAAVFDHPKAVETVVRMTGANTIKAIIHCQGSTSFSMSLAAGLVPQVTAVISNAVSFFPRIPMFSQQKLRFALPLLHCMLNYLNPHWGVDASTWQARFIRNLVRLTHHECDNDVCKLVSFTYGSGHPALWRHENLNPETHEWLKNEFANVPLTFFDQIYRSVRRGSLVSVERLPQLPEDFAAQAPKTDARFAFFAGEQNLCFLPESQMLAFDFLNRFRSNYHSLRIVPRYSHLDIFMGQDAVRDVFPQMIAELNWKEANHG